MLALWAAVTGPELLGVPWPTLGAGGLLGLCVLLILTGRLVPRSQLKDVQTERDAWKATALQAMSQNTQLMVGAKVASDVLKVLPDASRRAHEDST